MVLNWVQNKKEAENYNAISMMDMELLKNYFNGAQNDSVKLQEQIIFQVINPQVA